MAKNVYSWEPNTDYQKQIDNYVASGNYKEAAVAEQRRNQKIIDTGSKYSTTNNYSGWLDENDYGLDLKNMMGANVEGSLVGNIADQRQQNAWNTQGKHQYTYDDLWQQSQDYLSSGKGGFQYQDAPGDAYNYRETMNRLIGDYTNDNYDKYLQGNEYAQLANKYQTAGQQAMQNTMGAAAAQTGGIASSYASSAAAQAYNSYMGQLSDAAQSAYSNKRANDLSNINANRTGYQTLMDQYNTDRQLAYNAYDAYQNRYQQNYWNGKNYDLSKDAQSWSQNMDALNRQDTLANNQWQQSFAESGRELDQQNLEAERQYNTQQNAMNTWASLASAMISKGYPPQLAQQYAMSYLQNMKLPGQ